jgi:hypothetical protein
VQDAFDVVTVAVEAREIELGRARRQHRLRDGRVTRAQRIQVAAIGVVLRFGAGHEPEQCIGDTAAGGQHHTQAARGQLFKVMGDALEALGVSDRRTAELVNDPGGGVRRWHGKGRPEGGKKPGKSTGWTA